VKMTWPKIMSVLFHGHPVFKSLRNVYGVSVILAMLLEMYVQYFFVADHLICIFPSIYAVPVGLDPYSIFGHIFRD
jgi:hypothetical protein